MQHPALPYLLNYKSLVLACSLDILLVSCRDSVLLQGLVHQEDHLFMNSCNFYVVCLFYVPVSSAPWRQYLGLRVCIFWGGKEGMRGEGNFLNENKMEIKKLDVEKQLLWETLASSSRIGDIMLQKLLQWLPSSPLDNHRPSTVWLLTSGLKQHSHSPRLGVAVRSGLARANFSCRV